MIFRPLRSLYDWVLSWAHHTHAQTALFALAFAEASFFPIPPDVLLIAIALGLPKRAFRFAAIATVGSVLGGLAGYAIGHGLMASVGQRILDFYHLHAQFDRIRELYLQYDVWAVGVAGFTPIPYKVFTIAAGAFDMDPVRFTLASIISRGARFFLVAGLIYLYGAAIKGFIDRYFNLLTVIFTALLVGFFFVLAYL
ncbi:MAG TPA: YqaA family protein [Burkholderiales bacterium]|jgi:membrane protein YqaA with SNARE-associated domain